MRGKKYLWDVQADTSAKEVEELCKHGAGRQVRQRYSIATFPELAPHMCMQEQSVLSINLNRKKKMKVKFSWLLAWIIASVVLMYAGLFVCIVLGMQFGEWLLLTSVVMIPATLWLAEYAED